MNRNKTVYVLGAGVSKANYLPIQSELLYQIFTLRPNDIDLSVKNFMQLSINANEQNVMKFYEVFDKQRRELADFVINNFASRKEKYIHEKLMATQSVLSNDDWNRIYSIAGDLNVTMEDIFTLFDKVTLGQEHFRTYTTEMIRQKHEALKKCIIFLLAYKSTKTFGEETTSSHKFAKLIFNDRIKSSYQEDILSIITMNWDSILEREIYKLCTRYNMSKTKVKIYPDLCFYDYCFNDSETHIVSTHIKARKHKNIKIMKLHGSINWLVCTNCKRIYVDYDDDIAIHELSTEHPCPQCGKEFSDEENIPQMHSILITPTFLKDLNNLQLKNIWHNAFMDLSEASKVVFIGYSFPDADFEMRYLLKKAINPNTMIEVILHSSDDPLKYKSLLEAYKVSQNEINLVVDKLNLPERRYKSFFNKDKINIYYFGLEGYIEKQEAKYE
jgi:NAD-dependent SIR2 family protein deacetylase